MGYTLLILIQYLKVDEKKVFYIEQSLTTPLLIMFYVETFNFALKVNVTPII